jgi:hypothetical protein
VLVLGGFGVANQKHRLSSVLPELICFRHAHSRTPPSSLALLGSMHDKGPRARDLALPLQHFGGWVPIRPARLGTAVLAEDEAAVPVLRRVGVGHTTEHIA